MADILLVQSNPTRAVEIRMLLERAGCHVKHASSGKQAIQVLRDGNVDMVVTDIVLAEMSGVDFVRGVLGHFPAISVIFITNTGSDQLADAGLRAGAIACVCEEQLQSQLVGVVETVCRVDDGNTPYADLLTTLKSNTFDFELPSDARLISPLVALTVQVAEGMALLPRVERIRLGISLEHALVNAMYRGNLGLGPSVTPRHHDIICSNATTDLIETRKSQTPYKERVTKVRLLFDPSGIRITVSDGGNGFNVAGFFETAKLSRLNEDTGHGLLLMQRLTDELEFNLEGNEVTLFKNARPS